MAKIIHVMQLKNPKKEYLYLKLTDQAQYQWFKEDAPTDLIADTKEQAIFMARQHFKQNYICSIHCGFLYTLPERDEHGMNALFHQMCDSYNSMNGIFFNNDLGNNCIVRFASEEALNLKKKLKL